MREDAAQTPCQDMYQKNPGNSPISERRCARPIAFTGLVMVVLALLPSLTVLDANAQLDAGLVDPLRIRVKLPETVLETGNKALPMPDEVLRNLAVQLGAGLGRPWPESALASRSKRGMPELEGLAAWRELRLSHIVAPEVITRLLAERGVSALVERVYLHEIQVAASASLISPFLQPGEILDLAAAHALVRAADGEVVVAVVDAGTEWRHEDLVGTVYQNPGEIADNGLDDDQNGYVDDLIGWNFPLDLGDPTGLPQTPISAEHGTHISGIVCAADRNGLGVTGVSGGARLMAINVGHPERDRVVSFGYEGILYAALNGARVINCSWGRRGRWSHFEQEVLEGVEALGAVVVAAAGNSFHDRPFYPAVYPTVLSVTGIRGTLVHNTIGANAAYWIDVSAPGVDIISTLPGDRYGSRRGTSQATAHVSGIAALLLTQHPEWSPRQLREQIRWTAVALNDYNEPELFHRMGTGVVNAYRALTDTPPGVVIEEYGFSDEDGDGVVEASEVVTGSLRLSSVLREAPATKLEFFTDDPYLQPLLTELRVGGIALNNSLSATRAFSAWVVPQAPVAHIAELRIQITTAQDTVHTWLRLELNPLHVDLRGEFVEMGVAANGKLGYASLFREGDPGGVGLRRPGELPRILGGAFVIGISETQVSDAHYAVLADDEYEDFLPRGVQAARMEDDPDADRMAVVEFSDNIAPAPLGIGVRHEARLFDDAVRGRLVISRYILSSDREDLEGVRAGFLVDWAPHEGVSNSDQVHSDAAYQLAYVLDVSGIDGGSAAGLRVLEAPGPYAANWLPDVVQEGGRSPGFYNVVDYEAKLSDPELWDLLTRENDDAPSAPGNLSQMISVGPFDLPAGEEREIIVAWLLGKDETEIREQSELARQVQASLHSGFGGELATQLFFLPSAPNPFRSGSGGTMLRFTIPQEGRVRLRIFDSRGRLVRVLLDQEMLAGNHLCPWNGQDGSGSSIARGVYHLLLETPRGAAHRRVTLLE